MATKNQDWDEQAFEDAQENASLDMELDEDNAGWGADPQADQAADEWDAAASGWDEAGTAAADGADDGWTAQDGDVDMDDMKMEGLVPVQPPPMTRQQSFQVLNNDALLMRQTRLIKSTADLLFVSEEEASCLLRHYGWKNTKLQQDWFTDQGKVRKQCGVSVPPAQPFPARGNCSTAFCEEDVEGLALNCGHFFCNTCWSQFLLSQINHGRSCVFTSCMGLACTKKGCPHKFGCGCSEMVPDSVFARYVKEDALLGKYRRWVLASFVEGQKKIKWCPRPNCENAVESTAGGSRSVQCKCGHSFCFACLREAHVPAPCDLVKNWLEKEKSDDATEIWLAARTKECPKCQVRIEKNKACNHMKCVKCGHDFCWLCKGPWAQHGSSSGGYYVCNKYNDEQQRGNLSSEEKKMVENQQMLQKYTYYYKRFKGSADAISLTEKLLEVIEQKLKNEEVAKYNFLSDAVQKLIHARRTLQWTYAMAYYLKGGREKNLFEYQQNLLIENTENLQYILENTEATKLLTKRKAIIDLTGSIAKFTREMISQVENGDFEALLLTKADVETSSLRWACTNCTSENSTESVFCVSCKACRRHGEQDCRACNPK